MIAVVIIAAVGLALIVAWKVRATSGDLVSECIALRDRLAVETNTNERARIETALRACMDAARRAGLSIDETSLILSVAEETSRAVEAKWSDYKRTDYSDIIKRTSTRGDMLGLLDQLVTQLRDAANAARAAGGASVPEVRARIQREIVASLNRARCMSDDGSGCSRMGVNEPNWDERGRDEILHGAFALGLRDAVLAGWRSPADRPPDLGVTSMRVEDIGSDPAWQAWHRARGSGNYPPAELYRVGELWRYVEPTWDVFGGGPHYAGQYEAIRDAWAAAPDGTPYALVKPVPLTEAHIRRAATALYRPRLIVPTS